MCRYVNMIFIGCYHQRTLVLYTCVKNVNKIFPAPCYCPLVGIHLIDCINMPGRCPGCNPSPLTTQVCSPSAYFAKSFLALGADLISRGQWTSYNEMQIASREIFHWDMPPVPKGDPLFNEKGEESARLTTLKRDMMEQVHKLIGEIPVPTTPFPIYAPIWFGEKHMDK